MQFQLIKDSFTGSVSPMLILYTDANLVVWSVPVEHRFWQVYQDWLALGNTPLPAA